MKERENPVSLDGKLVEELREYALHDSHTTVQVAACIGLERIGNQKAVLALSERVLNGGAWRPTERAMEALAELASKGGLLALTATLLGDNWSIYRKLTLLFEGARNLHNYRAAEAIEAIYRHASTKFEFEGLVPEMLSMLERNPLLDISKGATLTRLFLPIPAWAGAVTMPQDAQAERAVAYAKLRLPGLGEILKAHGSRGMPKKQRPSS